MIRLSAFFSAAALCAAPAAAQPIRFLVSEYGPPLEGDSYVIVLEDEADLAHARALIDDFENTCCRVVYADIAPGADGINRDHLADGAPEWSWHVSNFVAFTDATPEILDGTPTQVEADVKGWIANTEGQVGFWSYTVTAELGPLCPGDFDASGVVGVNDLIELLGHWGACGPPCQWDLDGSGDVGVGDLLAILAAWGPCA